MVFGIETSNGYQAKVPGQRVGTIDCKVCYATIRKFFLTPLDGGMFHLCFGCFLACAYVNGCELLSAQSLDHGELCVSGVHRCKM